MTFSDIIVRRKNLLLACAIMLTGGWAAVSGPRGLQDFLEKRRLIRELEDRNATLAAENTQRRERIQKLSGSPVEQEIIIRDQLKLAKPGETIFVLPPDSDAKPDNGKGDSKARP